MAGNLTYRDPRTGQEFQTINTPQNLQQLQGQGMQVVGTQGSSVDANQYLASRRDASTQPGFSAQPVGTPQLAMDAVGRRLQNLNQMPGYDPAFAAAETSLSRREAGIASEEELARRRMQEDYQLQESEAERARKRVQEELEARMAQQGILRSGINVGEQAEVGEEHQRFIGQLGQRRARGLEDLGRDVTRQREAIQQERAQLQMERARQQAQQQLEQLLQQIQNQQQQVLAGQMPQRSPSGQYQPGGGGSAPAGGIFSFLPQPGAIPHRRGL